MKMKLEVNCRGGENVLYAPSARSCSPTPSTFGKAVGGNRV